MIALIHFWGVQQQCKSRLSCHCKPVWASLYGFGQTVLYFHSTVCRWRNLSHLYYYYKIVIKYLECYLKHFKITFINFWSDDNVIDEFIRHFHRSNHALVNIAVHNHLGSFAWNVGEANYPLFQTRSIRYSSRRRELQI